MWLCLALPTIVISVTKCPVKIGNIGDITEANSKNAVFLLKLIDFLPFSILPLHTRNESLREGCHATWVSSACGGRCACWCDVWRSAAWRWWRRARTLSMELLRSAGRCEADTLELGSSCQACWKTRCQITMSVTPILKFHKPAARAPNV